MAEMLMRWRPRGDNGPDPKIAQLRDQVGDVIVVMPDGHPWSQDEQTNPEWRIIKVPGTDITAFNAFVQPDENALRQSTRYRAVALDVTHTGLVAALASKQVAQLPAAVLNAAKRIKPAVQGIVVIG